MSLSEQCFLDACRVIPGGVNSPVRAFKGVGGSPIFFQKAQGAYLWDVDDKRYIDYVGSWGPAILGHTHPEVLSALTKQMQNGLSFGAPTQLETELAHKVIDFFPSIEQVRFVSSGTEATLSAIRLARGFTGRNKILKFEGCYHGHGDSLLVKAGSGLLTLGVPTSAGIPEDFAKHTLTATFNDIAEVARLFAEWGEDIAGVIIEPIAGNMNLVKPNADFLAGLRQICDDYHSVLIFDEVMTGFRVAKGGAQALYGVKPDLTTLGKVIGGGLPVGAFGGRSDIMACLAPLGPVYQAGTLSGNPMAMRAGLTTLQIIERQGDFYERLQAFSSALMAGLQQVALDESVALTTDSIGGMIGFYFTEQTTITTYADVMQCDLAAFKDFFHRMLKQGVYLAPSAFEAGFVSIAHTTHDLDQTLSAARAAFKRQ